MKHLARFPIVILCLSIVLLYQSCKNDNPVEPGTPLESVAPTVFIQSPTTNIAFVTTQSSVSITGAAGDDVGLSEIRWSSSSGGAGIATGLTQWAIPSISLQTGDNRIIVTALDGSGNQAQDNITITQNQYLLFLGIPSVAPSAIVVNTSANITVRTSIAPNDRLIQSSVTLVQVDGNNVVVAELGQMFDDGVLSHGDEIIGDGVFSAIVSPGNSATGEIRLRVRAQTQETTGPVNGFSAVSVLTVVRQTTDTEYQQVFSTQTAAVNKLNEYFGNRNVTEAVTQTAQWLRTQPQVASVTQDGSASILINYSSGLTGGVLISDTDSNGTVLTRGGGVSGERSRLSPPVIPKSQWTVGSNASMSPGTIPDTLVLNKKVLIYAPYENVFSPSNEGSTIRNILEQSGLGFTINYLPNQAAGVAGAFNMTDYGLVILATHGIRGQWFGTGEFATTVNQATYAVELAAGQIGIITNSVINKILWIFEKKADVYYIHSSFINALPETFPNTIVLNNSCESTMNSDLSTAFFNKGAKTYYGFSKVVNSRFCVQVTPPIVQKLVVDLMNSGEAFIPGQIDPGSPYAVLEMRGNTKMRYPTGLINGDFEYGDLSGWTETGDGRVISQLANLAPPDGSFMNIISTGLGFTTQTGSISQGFKVLQAHSTLRLKWNFLSEEFLEFIGSQFQDYFRITIRKADGSVVTVLDKNIDAIASQFGATTTDPGNLISVSPGIVFDHAGVYMTGWQDLSIDISPYRDETITVTLTAGDVGDSNYDTAILLDAMVVE